jgi:gamma-aminobutyric acid type B receptor
MHEIEFYDIPTGGLVPYDGIPTKEFVAIAIPVTVIFVFLASAGIIFAIVCLIFNFIYRKKK